VHTRPPRHLRPGAEIWDWMVMLREHWRRAWPRLGCEQQHLCPEWALAMIRCSQPAVSAVRLHTTNLLLNHVSLESDHRSKTPAPRVAEQQHFCRCSALDSQSTAQQPQREESYGRRSPAWSGPPDPARITPIRVLGSALKRLNLGNRIQQGGLFTVCGLFWGAEKGIHLATPAAGREHGRYKD